MSRNITNDELKFYKEVIPSMNVIFDVGTMKDLIFYELNPWAKIHMFDPVREYIDYMINAVKDKPHNIKFNNFGLGSKKGKKTFYNQYGSIIHRDIPRFKGMHNNYIVQIHTLNSYCDKYKIKSIDYLKIDTEGFDFEVIKGADKYLDKIRFIQFEDFKVFYNGETIQNIFDYFKGWKIYKIGGKPCNYLATKETVNLKKIR